ncbi:hypothetical protein V3I01_12965 [Sphingomonas sp. gentR]|uniref:hypothetical protein n=1 Tax=unclassified Sphingomonas TaxID=196159 RepID=UPI0009726EDF|nr:hypothetical protein [Sphingomonas sp. LK11]APX67009.1 hypothetical protein AV944_15520 [Sphingomonas sp. LK11]
MDRRLFAASLAIAGLLGGCSASAERQLEGRVFDIPEANAILENDAPFFLPALDPRDGFSFYLNPGALLPDLNLVGVASKQRMCARAAGTAARINSTVCATSPLSWRGQPLRRVSDGVFWTYDLPAETGQKPPRSLASCFTMENSQAGLCTASLPYGDLVLTIHFRDNQIASLQDLYDQSAASLWKWER